MKRLIVVSAGLACCVVAVPALAQVNWSMQGNQQGMQTNMSGQPVQTYPATTTSSSSHQRGPTEMAALYPIATAYGVGMGVWLSTEIGSGDPATFLIPPIILGVAAPIGVFALDHPKMHRGMPMAITTGMLLGAGEGLGIYGTQFVRTNDPNAWGFHGLTRSVGIGATVGAGAGWAAGYFMEPPPATSILALSGAAWGVSIGSMFGYGATSGDSDYAHANDTAAIGGLIGYNVGMAAAAGYGALDVPSATQIGWMWGGAGIGAAASLPIFLAYAGEGGPPARRGFIFTGTATTLGLIAGGVLSSDSVSIGKRQTEGDWAGPVGSRLGQIQAVIPVVQPDQVGVSLVGTLD
jgi:hypothetical protein